MAHSVIADHRRAAETESGDVILSGARVQCEIGEVLAGADPGASFPTFFVGTGS